eukprot:scaffold4116_cov27-Tisochrysis_lutea.AAC.3
MSCSKNPVGRGTAVGVLAIARSRNGMRRNLAGSLAAQMGSACASPPVRISQPQQRWSHGGELRSSIESLSQSTAQSKRGCSIRASN